MKFNIRIQLFFLILASLNLKIVQTKNFCNKYSCDKGNCCNNGKCVKLSHDEPLCFVENGCNQLKGDCLTLENDISSIDDLFRRNYRIEHN